MNRRTLDTLLLIVAAAALWQILFVVAGSDAIASPLATLQRLITFGQDPRFWTNAGATLAAFAYACVLSIAIGLPLGVAVGAHKLARDVAEPMLSAFYSIPKITLYPVILLIFGLGLSAKVAFGVIHGVFPIALFAIGAIRNLSPSLIRTARVLHLSPLQTATSVLAPAALPEILTGLRVGVSTLECRDRRNGRAIAPHSCALSIGSASYPGLSTTPQQQQIGGFPWSCRRSRRRSVRCGPGLQARLWPPSALNVRYGG